MKTKKRLGNDRRQYLCTCSEGSSLGGIEELVGRPLEGPKQLINFEKLRKKKGAKEGFPEWGRILRDGDEGLRGLNA